MNDYASKLMAEVKAKTRSNLNFIKQFRKSPSQSVSSSNATQNTRKPRS